MIKKLVWSNIETLINDPFPQFDYVLPGLLKHSVGSIVGSGGIGKSMLALQLSAHIATGLDLLDLGPLPEGDVIYLSAEDAEIIFRARLKYLAEKMTQNQRQKLISHFHLLPLVGHAPDLLTADWATLLMSLARKQPRLVVLDTFRRFHSSNELDSGEMSKVLAVLEELCGDNTTIVFIHHVNKSSAQNGNITQQASRGSSVLSDHVRWQLHLAPMAADEAKTLYLDEHKRQTYAQLSWTKMNYSAPLEPIWLERTEGGILVRAPLFPNELNATANNNKEQYNELKFRGSK